MIRTILNTVLFIWIISLPFKNAIFQLSSFFILLLALVSIVKEHHIGLLQDILIRYQDILLLFISIVITMYISNFLGTNSIKGYRIPTEFLFRYGVMFISLLYFYKIKYINKKNLLYFILISLVLQAILGLYQQFVGMDILTNKVITYGYRIYGGMFNPNPFGLVMAIGAIIITSLLMGDTRMINQKISLLTLNILLLIFLFAMLYSGSRSSWLMYGVFVLSQFIFIQTKNKKKLFYISVGIFLILLFFIVNSSDLSFRFHQLMVGYSSSRVDMWIDIIHVFIKNPILGYGPDAFKTIIHSSVNSTHNSFLEILLFTGIMGLVFFTFLIGKVYFEAKKNNNPIYISLFFALLLVSQFDHSVFTSKIFLTILVLYSFYIFSFRLDSDDKKDYLND